MTTIVEPNATPNHEPTGPLDPIFEPEQVVWLKLRYQRKHSYPECEESEGHPLKQQLQIVAASVKDDPTPDHRSVAYLVRATDGSEYLVWQDDLEAKPEVKPGMWGFSD